VSVIASAAKQSRSRLLRRFAPPRNDIVIGVGNPDRGDDGVGRAVAYLLKPYMQAIEHDGEATSLLDLLGAAERVWLVDAARSGAVPGTIHRIDCAIDIPQPGNSPSSHGLGIAEAIGLARALGELPPHCIVYAIEAASFAPGAPLSPRVARAAREVAARILVELTPRRPSVRRPRHPAPAPDRR
jgi:hydrogenase maturation protease